MKTNCWLRLTSVYWQVLNETSLWWFNKTQHIVPNAVVSVPDKNVTIAKKCSVFPIEFVGELLVMIIGLKFFILFYSTLLLPLANFAFPICNYFKIFCLQLCFCLVVWYYMAVAKSKIMKLDHFHTES